MRKLLGTILVLVGVLCIAAAGLLRFYVPSRAEKTPLNLDIKLVSTGPAKILNPATGQQISTSLNATRRVRTDASASNSSVTVVNETLCLVMDVGNPPECVGAQDPQHRLVSSTADRVAADRKSGESVNDPKYGESVDGDTAARHVGLSYKWPFHAKKQTYKFYDPASRQAPDAKFIGTEKLNGLTLYKYQAVIDNIDLPVAAGVLGKYSDTRIVSIDPVTGVIVKGIEHQVRTLASGLPVFDTTLTFNQAAIDYQAKQAKDGRSKITLLTVTLPLILLVVGVIALGAALLVVRRGNGAGTAAGQPVPADQHSSDT